MKIAPVRVFSCKNLLTTELDVETLTTRQLGRLVLIKEHATFQI